MAYIDTKYLFDCNTCRHNRSGKCDTWCDHSEEYRPDMSKIPIADVVEVVRCKDCGSFNKHYKECNLHGSHFGENGFCCEGKRKMDERTILRSESI